MEYNLRGVRKDVGLFGGLKSRMIGRLGIFGGLTFMLIWVMAILISMATAVGIPVGILWCIAHYIHNGYKW